jgi:endonuclease YncB( thermonuclease family)
MTSLMMVSKGRILLWSAAFVLWTAPTHADFSGPVVSVLDGDTIEVLHNTHPESIRLGGIDCPETAFISSYQIPTNCICMQS